MRGRGGTTVVGLVVTCALSACGDSDEPTTSARVVADAAAKTSALGTARVSTTMSGSINGRTVGDGSQTGIVDGRRGRAALTFDLSFIARASGSFDPNSLRGEVVYYGDVVFLSTPALSAELPTGKRWVELTLDQIVKSGGPGNALAGLGSPDPTKPVDYLRATEGDAEPHGSGEVYGTPAKRYRVTVDLRRYVSMAAPRDQPGLERTVEKFRQIVGTTKVPLEVWIADDGTIRRVRGDVAANGSDFMFTVELAGIGKPQPVRPPGRARVIDARKLPYP